jgi:DNA sulfur modification protein DndE
MSLTEPQVPEPSRYDEDGLEFNRSTLLGEWDDLYEALLRQRLADDGLDPVADFYPQLRAHMNRGSELVCNRIRDLTDVVTLLPRLEPAASPPSEHDDAR